MRKLINYIRQCFCNHEWELLQENEVWTDEDGWGQHVKPFRIGLKWTYRCKKCGYFVVHKNY